MTPWSRIGCVSKHNITHGTMATDELDVQRFKRARIKLGVDEGVKLSSGRDVGNQAPLAILSEPKRQGPPTALQNMDIAASRSPSIYRQPRRKHPSSLTSASTRRPRVTPDFLPHLSLPRSSRPRGYISLPFNASTTTTTTTTTTTIPHTPDCGDTADSEAFSLFVLCNQASLTTIPTTASRLVQPHLPRERLEFLLTSSTLHPLRDWQKYLMPPRNIRD